MSDHQEIYIVTADDGDTVTIRAVFTEKPLAEKYVEVFNSTHNSWDWKASIETHVANPHRKVLEGECKYFKVVMNRDGDLVEDVAMLPTDLRKASSHHVLPDRSRLEMCLWCYNGPDAVVVVDKQRKLLIETGQW